MPLPSSTRHVGLLNLGNTCYMNSMIQILFSVSEFRDSLLSLSLPSQPASLLFQFQLLLTSLLRSQRPFYDPSAFCRALGVDVNRQMDVDEFFSTFMDRLEECLGEKKSLIREQFGGSMRHSITCEECRAESVREELCLSLPLVVKNKSSIQEGLAELVMAESLYGQNAYHCE